jgi:hypothetical protein
MIFGKKKPETEESEAPKEQNEEKSTLSPAQIREKLKEGGVQVILTFEVAGSPKEHVEASLKGYLDNIENHPQLWVLSKEHMDTDEQEDNIFSAAAELEVVVEKLEILTWLSVNFMPAAIEIVEPEKLTLEAREVNNWYNDLLAKLHETSNILREERAVNKHLTTSLNALIKNAILAAVTGDGKTSKELQKATGIAEQQLEPFLKNLVEKKKLRLSGEKYVL